MNMHRDEDGPDHIEAQLMDIEFQRQRSALYAENNRFFLYNLHAAANHLDEQNRLSIARGDGPLPF